MSALTGYRLAILTAAARPEGQLTDAYGTCAAARGAADWLVQGGYVTCGWHDEGDVAYLHWYATAAGKDVLAYHNAGSALARARQDGDNDAATEAAATIVRIAP